MPTRPREKVPGPRLSVRIPKQVRAELFLSLPKPSGTLRAAVADYLVFTREHMHGE
jgi:hypothetical protein